MNGPGSDPRSLRRRSGGSQSQNERIIWFAFLISPVIYAIVGYMVLGGHTVSTKAPALPFYVIGLLVALAALAAPRFIPEAEPAATELVPTTRIITWAIDESVSIIGFVGVFLGSFPVTTFVLFAIVSMGLIWLHRPGD